jgi:hypothetical protein
MGTITKKLRAGSMDLLEKCVEFDQVWYRKLGYRAGVIRIVDATVTHIMR